MSGNQDGTVSIWDTLVPPTPLNGSEPVLQPMATFAAHNETVNSLRLTASFFMLFSLYFYYLMVLRP